MSTIPHLTGDALLRLFPQPLERKTRNDKNGGEWHGSCPNCGGTKRFLVQPEQGRWTCRRCIGVTQWYNDVDFILWRNNGYTMPSRHAADFKKQFTQACNELNLSPADKQSAPVRDLVPNDYIPPSPQWQEKANAFALWCADNLQSGNYPEANAYIAQRGISEETARNELIGYNPTFFKRPADKWGLLAIKDNQLRLLPGLIFPWMVGGDCAIHKLQIRNIHTDDPRFKTYVVSGSGNCPYGVNTILSKQPLVLVEGPFDYLTVLQECADLMLGCIAVGATWARETRWIIEASRASRIILATDNDTAGNDAAVWWMDVFTDRAVRLLPTDKDPNEMLKNKRDIRAWIESAL